MKRKAFKKFFGRFTWPLARILSDLIAWMPLSFNYLLGFIAGRCFYLFDRKLRNIALKSLRIAFPEKSLQERRRLTKQFCVIMLQSFFEMGYFLKHPQRLNQITVEGVHYLDEALQGKKGIIGLTGHFGNFTLMHFKLAQMGYPVAVMTRPMRNKQANDHSHRIRDRTNIKTIYTIPKVEAAAKTIRSLRGNDLVIIQMDQDFREHGVWVDFFGQLASTAPGPVVFALRTQAVILPMFIVREGFGKHRIKIFPPYQMEINENRDQTILNNVQKLTKIIEDWVREYPQQWGWINDRWKTRPVMLESKREQETVLVT